MVGVRINMRNLGSSCDQRCSVMMAPATGQTYRTRSPHKGREVEISTQRAQDRALEKYFHQMSLLLIERGPYDPPPSTEIRVVARASTLTVLQRLDGVRRGSVVRFLCQSGLIGNDSVIVDLRGALLREADLSGANLSDVKLNETDLIGANLSRAVLDGADMSRTDLSEADVS
jgi:Pentapeptide repeats (8 copies)